MIVSRCYLKFLSNRICSYCTKGALVKVISPSGSGIAAFAARGFLDLDSFLISVCKKKLYSIVSFCWEIDFSDILKIPERDSIDIFFF